MANAYPVRIIVTLKTGVLDPQGKAIEQSLASLGFETAQSVRQGRYFDVVIEAGSQDEAKTEAEAMCEKLLANTVIEDYRIEMATAPAGATAG
ncbi:MAG: phosphoribosylformylglycinamidine synthase subunit PurS [Pseudomonadota bacterium]